MNDEAKEITRFDPNQFADQLREKIQLDIATFLPEDVWAKKVEEEVNAFLEGKWEKDQYGYHQNQRFIPSGLTTAVQEVMLERTKELARDWLNANQTFDGRVSEAVERVVADNIGKIVSAAMGPILQNAINNMHP